MSSYVLWRGEREALRYWRRYLIPTVFAIVNIYLDEVPSGGRLEFPSTEGGHPDIVIRDASDNIVKAIDAKDWHNWDTLWTDDAIKNKLGTQIGNNQRLYGDDVLIRFDFHEPVPTEKKNVIDAFLQSKQDNGINVEWGYYP